MKVKRQGWEEINIDMGLKISGENDLLHMGPDIYLNQPSVFLSEWEKKKKDLNLGEYFCIMYKEV